MLDSFQTRFDIILVAEINSNKNNLFSKKFILKTNDVNINSSEFILNSNVV